MEETESEIISDIKDPYKSEEIDKLAAALAKAQGSFAHPRKTIKVNVGTYSYWYADLPAVIDAIREVFAPNGLSFTQFPSMNWKRKAVLCKTIIFHSSGQWISSEVEVTTKDFSAQSIGSGITYARRYALSAMAGVAAETDEDGSAATGKSNVSFNKKK